MPQSLLRTLEDFLASESEEVLDETFDVEKVVLGLFAYFEEHDVGKTGGGFAATALLVEILNQARSIRAMALQLFEKAQALPTVLARTG